MHQHTLFLLVSIPATSPDQTLLPTIKKQQEILTLIQVKPIRAVGNTAIGYFIQVVARFTGHALVTMASNTGFTIG